MRYFGKPSREPFDIRRTGNFDPMTFKRIGLHTAGAASVTAAIHASD